MLRSALYSGHVTYYIESIPCYQSTSQNLMLLSVMLRSALYSGHVTYYIESIPCYQSTSYSDLFTH